MKKIKILFSVLFMIMILISNLALSQSISSANTLPGNIDGSPDGLVNVDIEMLGEGVQRRYLFGDVAYDRRNNKLYVLELFADESKPVVHVWKIR